MSVLSDSIRRSDFAVLRELHGNREYWASVNDSKFLDSADER